MQLPERYRVIRELGRGGMGVVYLAFDSLLRRHVAIKSVLRPQGEDQQLWHDAVQRLIREAQSAAILRHPNIVSIYDVLLADEGSSIVMEYVDGKTLIHFAVPGNGTDPRFLMHVLKQCANALDYGHSRGIVHRDVKPSNIMLEEDGSVHITDFGIAKQLNSTTDLTHGMPIGTLGYMSPEQLKGEAIDGGSDQYSLAVMSYELLTGCKIFEAQSFGAKCAMILNQTPPPASTRLSGLPAGVDPILARALNKTSKARYATCMEFVSALGAVLVGPTSDTPPKETPSVSGSQTERSAKVGRALFGALVGMLVAIALAGGFWFVTNTTGHKQFGLTENAKGTSRTANRGPETAPTNGSTAAAAEMPVISEFSTSKDSVQPGEPIVIRWRVLHAASVSIRGVGNDLPVGGSRTITASSTTRSYILEAAGPSGTAHRTLTVSVRAPHRSLPAIGTFTASRLSIDSGDSTLLQWSVTGASTISISQLGGMLPGQTSRIVCPTRPKTYVLSASSPAGSVTRSVRVDVRIPPGENVRLNQFSADPLSIASGDTSVLRWQVANASKVWIEPSIGEVDACGMLKVQPREATKYQLSYQNDRGTMRSKPVLVNVH